VATNFGKRLHRLTPPTGDQRERAIAQLQEWSEKPLHRWIPAAQVATSGLATITDRQAQWLHFELQRKKIDADFEPAEPRQ
jgi:hypothetical protein